MMTMNTFKTKLTILAGCVFSFCAGASGAPLNISDSPLILTQDVPPLTLIILGRNHKLFYEAYNDATDLNEDGSIDIRYNPNIDYYGYFDSYKCYTYNSGNSRFEPASTTSNKQCSGQWSGDYLNYLTMSRMDALRKVLYGGYRSTDSSTDTVLERAFIPQDAHSWGKEYKDVSTDGYDISNYTPLSVPTSSNRHLFANTTILGGSGDPLLRVLTNQPYRIWEWVSIERPVANNRVLDGSTGPTVSPTDYIVRVKVCDSSVGLETNCRAYPSGANKPIGLLQDFGENDQMKFGLLTGSFTKNLSGGVLRKNVTSFTDEVDANTGQFTTTNGIVKTIDKLMIPNFQGNYEHQSTCGFIFNRAVVEGECRSWGNPIAEMMYEGMRYFAGKANPTSAFDYSSGDDVTLGLPKVSWSNPYDSSNNEYCAKPNFLIISETSPSYDSDQVPGTSFGSFSGDLSPSMNVTTLGQTIWNTEKGGSSSHFIGQVGSNFDGAPTAKTVSSFGNIRGLTPEEPTRQGSYYSASVAYYGSLNDISSAQDDQNVKSFAVALESHVPSINISVNGQTITIVPFAKSVGGCGAGIDPSSGAFQATNTIVDFYIESLTATSGTFRINFEDVEQGADHDMDAIARFTYTVNGDNTVTVTVDSTYAAGCIIQHIGYVISGTTNDGAYLVVRDFDTGSGSDIDYFLDTPPGESPGGNWNDSADLPLTSSITFTPSSSPAATVLNNPLWYVAKWGGFTDRNGNNVPDLDVEWDADGNNLPDNYFLVTNALQLEAKLESALNNILDRNASSAGSTTNSGTLSSTTRIYMVAFNSGTWTGQLLSFPIDSSTGQVITTGSGPNGSEWDAGEVLSTQNYDTGREIITYKPSTSGGIAFRWPANESSPTSSELDASQVTILNTNPDTASDDSQGENRLNYLRGDDSLEEQNGGSFRDRSSTLGDIVNSEPAFVGKPNFTHRDSWPSGAPENAVAYSSFKSTYTNRTPLIYVGANDGILHAFDANSGAETMAYIPSKVFENLTQLPKIDYSHRYYVDASPTVGDVFYDSAWHTILVGGLNKGGQGIYALDITNPSSLTESNASTVVLWEYTDAQDSDLGYTYSQPIIARLANGEWAAIFGNGYNNTESDGAASTTGNAVLYIVNIKTGALIKKIDTGVGMSADPLSSGRPNGLGAPIAVDVNNDQITDYIYAGDLFGNLWKFDVSSSSTSSWGVDYSGNPLFVAEDASGNRQPITAKLTVGPLKTNNAKPQIYFGTGKFIEPSDKVSSNFKTQTFYAITDDGSSVVSGRSELLQQSILDETTTTKGSTTSTVRITSNNTRSSSHKGWYIDLEFNSNVEGERVTARPVLRGDRIIFTTLIPSDNPCEFGGTGWLMEFYAYDGRRLNESPFDLNNDSTFTTADKVTYGSGPVIAVSGIKSTAGIIATPAIISDGDKEYKYFSSSSGSIQTVTENPVVKEGRKSWRQIK